MKAIQGCGKARRGRVLRSRRYVSIDGQLSAVCAISYAKMRSAAAGLAKYFGVQFHKNTTL